MRSTIGRVQSVSNTKLVLEDSDGTEISFKIRKDDLASVNPPHVKSHIDVPEIAFRIYYREIDGERYALAADETSSEGLE